MEAVRRPVSLGGLSRFLAEHEPCDAGFDVEHPTGVGNGLISMTCRGCGKAYQYSPGTIEIEREVEFAPVLPPAVGAPRELPERRQPKAENQTRDRMVAAGLLILAIAAFAVALIRVLDANEADPEPTPPPAATATPPPVPEPQPEAQPTPEPQSAQPTPAEPVNPLIAGPGEKEMRMLRYSLIVPEAWTQRPADGGTAIGPPGTSPISVQVFFEENPAVGIASMVGQSRLFAVERVGGGRPGPVSRTRVGGDPAFELTAGRGGTSATILGVLDGAYRYLVVGDIGVAATPQQAASVRRALETFRPA